jgi:hypothetical protein
MAIRIGGGRGTIILERINALNIFFQDHFLGGMRHHQFTQVPHMGGRPVGLSLIMIAIAQQERFKLLFRAPEFLCGIRASAADIADHLVINIRDMNRRQMAGPQEDSQFTRIAPVGLLEM